MSDAEYDKLRGLFQEAEELVKKRLYEKALDNLQECEKLSLAFPGSRFIYETRRLISLCMFSLHRLDEAVYERELAAEEIARLGDYDEAGEIYKELGDRLRIAGKTDAARKYYSLAQLSFNTWVSKDRNEPSPPEAWVAWALVCQAEAANTEEMKLKTFVQASEKFAEAAEKKKVFENFYRSRELFLKARVALIMASRGNISANNSALRRAHEFFDESSNADISWPLARACEKLTSALLLLEKTESQAKRLLIDAKNILRKLEKKDVADKLRSLIDKFLFDNRRNTVSFCRSVEENLVI